jgi:hypothetical protein
MSFFNRADASGAASSATVTKYTSPDGTVLVQISGDYTCVQGETVIEVVDSSATRTITLLNPKTLPPGTELTVKDGWGQADSFNITLATAGIVPDTDPMLWGRVFSGSDLGTVVAATAAALSTCVAAGSGVGKTLTASANGAISIDGVTPSASDAVLVKNQVNSLDNGLYTVTQVGSASLPFILTRKTSFDATAECLPGSVANISAGGSTNGSTRWALRGGIDGAKTKVISVALGKTKLFTNGLDWRTLI